jgi:hypothetical protein
MHEDSRKYVTKYVEDLHSLVTHGLKPVSQQVGEARARQHASATQLITDIQSTMQAHERQLGERLSSLGTSPTTAVQDTVAAVAGVVAGLYNQVRTEAVSKSVRDDYTFVSHCSVSWMMLMTTARSLGDHQTDELAETGYRDCARLLMQIDRVMPTLVFEELQQDGLPAQDVSSWTHTIVSEAWTREAVTA